MVLIIHFIVHFTVHFTVNLTVNFTVKLSVQFTVHLIIHFTAPITIHFTLSILSTLSSFSRLHSTMHLDLQRFCNALLFQPAVLLQPLVLLQFCSLQEPFLKRMIHSKSILEENLLQYGFNLCTPLPQPFLSLLGLGPLESILRTICNVPKSPNEHLKKILSFKNIQQHILKYYKILTSLVSLQQTRAHSV